jgi:hypothetical protein
VLAPYSTKVATKIGRLGDKQEEGASELADLISESSGDDDEDMLTESEGTPDPYSTSALGMYGGVRALPISMSHIPELVIQETDNAYVEVEDDAVQDEDEDVDMEYPENDFATDDSGTDEEDQVMNLAQGEDVDADDSDEEEEEDFDGDEDDIHGGDDEVDDGEDEGESGEEEDGADEADMLWQVCLCLCQVTSVTQFYVSTSANRWMVVAISSVSVPLVMRTKMKLRKVSCIIQYETLKRSS